MKTKKHYYVILLVSLLVFMFLLFFGISELKQVYADEVLVTENTVAPEDTTTEESNENENENENDIVNLNYTVKAWIDTVLGGAGVTLDALLIALLTRKKDQNVTVKVDDTTTQTKLDTLTTEYDNLKKLVVDIFRISKGTLDVLLALYSDNKHLDENVRGVIKTISLNSEDVIKDVSDILDADKHKATKTALNSISNIVLG